MFALWHVAKHYRAQQSPAISIISSWIFSWSLQGFFEVCHVAATLVQPEEESVVEKKSANWYDSEKGTLLMRNGAEASYNSILIPLNFCFL